MVHTTRSMFLENIKCRKKMTQQQLFKNKMAYKDDATAPVQEHNQCLRQPPPDGSELSVTLPAGEPVC